MNHGIESTVSDGDLYLYQYYDTQHCDISLWPLFMSGVSLSERFSKKSQRNLDYVQCVMIMS